MDIPNPPTVKLRKLGNLLGFQHKTHDELHHEPKRHPSIFSTPLHAGSHSDSREIEKR
jgi:hypothetical protein